MQNKKCPLFLRKFFAAAVLASVSAASLAAGEQQEKLTADTGSNASAELRDSVIRDSARREDKFIPGTNMRIDASIISDAAHQQDLADKKAGIHAFKKTEPPLLKTVNYRHLNTIKAMALIGIILPEYLQYYYIKPARKPRIGYSDGKTNISYSNKKISFNRLF